MTFASVYSRNWAAIVFFLLLGTGMAQRMPVDPNRRPPTAPTASIPDATFQPQFISGKVALEGNGVPGEPVAVERICGGAALLLGYTDSKGRFQFPLATTPGFQD